MLKTIGAGIIAIGVLLIFVTLSDFSDCSIVVEEVTLKCEKDLNERILMLMVSVLLILGGLWVLKR